MSPEGAGKRHDFGYRFVVLIHIVGFKATYSTTAPKPTVPLRRTFASIFGPGPSKGPDLTPLVPSTTYLGDYEYRQPNDLPDKCEVTTTKLQDPVLRPFYKNLPPL